MMINTRRWERAPGVAPIWQPVDAPLWVPPRLLRPPPLYAHPGIDLVRDHGWHRRASHDRRTMLHSPRSGNWVREASNLPSTATTTFGISVTTGGSSSTKGTPAEIFSATSFETYWVRVIAHSYGSSTAASQGCLDILYGASTEAVLMENLLHGYAGGFAADPIGYKSWDFPVYIPAGTRIAAQAAGARTNTAFRVCVILYGGDGIPPHRVGGAVTTYGVSSVPNGTSLTPGASGANGTPSEITASTVAAHFALVPSFQLTGDTTINLRNYAVQIGVGSSTEDFGKVYLYWTTGLEGMMGPFDDGFPDMMPYIPAGTRLSMRASNSGTNDGGYNGAIHAVS